MTAPISNGPTTHGYTTMRDATCWAKFFAEMLLEAHCRANFFAEMPVEAPCWASFLAGERERALCWAKFFVELLRNGCVGRSLSRASSRGGPTGRFCAT